MEKSPNTYAALEAALFAYGEPMPRTRLIELLGIPAETLDEMLATLKEKLENDPDRGVMLLDQGTNVQLVTKPEDSHLLSTLFKAEVAEELTQAALETLALITYFGPITRAKLEYVRGVNSAFTLRNLLIRGLIERISEGGRGASHQYRASADLLRHLGIQGQSELPDFETLQQLLARTESVAQPAAAEAPVTDK